MLVRTKNLCLRISLEFRVLGSFVGKVIFELHSNLLEIKVGTYIVLEANFIFGIFECK